MTRCNIFSLILTGLIFLFSSADAQIDWHSTGLSEKVTDLVFQNGKSYLLTKSGCYISSDEKSWQKLKTTTASEDYNSVVVLESGEIFLFGYNYYSLSTDGGANWKKVSQTNFSTRKCIADGIGNLYAGENDPIMLSTDKGKTWAKSEKGTSGSFFDIAVFAVSDNGDVYAGNQGITGGMVYRSTDHGKSWNLIHSENMDDVSFITIANGTIWIAYTHTLIYSIDDGANWSTATNTPFPITALLFTGENDGLAGMFSVGLFSTLDGGGSWFSNMWGIHGKIVNKLVRSPGGNIFCGTDSGLYYTSSPASVKEEGGQGSEILLSPNPAQNQVQLQTGFTGEGALAIEVYDETGRKILSAKMEGDHLLNTSSLTNGSYLVVARSKDQVQTAKLVIMK